MRYRSLLYGVLMVVFAPRTAAHVDYVYDEPVPSTTAELLQAVFDPFSLSVLVGTPVIIIILLVVLYRSRFFARDITVVEDALADDRSFVPFILRLSMGVPLIGAGFQEYLFTPAVPFANRILLVALGFFLIFGLATRFVAGLSLVFYLSMLPIYPDLVLAFEFVPGLLAIILLGAGRPSIDQLLIELAKHDDTQYSSVDPVYGHLVKPFSRFVDRYQYLVPVILRLGLGVALIYLGLVQKLLQPDIALSVVHKYGLTAVVPVSPELWVVGAALAEIAVGLWLLVGIWTRLAAAILFSLFTLTLFGLPNDPVLPNTSLFGLIAVILILGSGKVSIDALWNKE